MTTAHDFSFKSIDGGALPMSKFKGKAVLVVNVASQCGYTPQYEGLEALYKKYKDKGFVILDEQDACHESGTNVSGCQRDHPMFQRSF